MKRKLDLFEIVLGVLFLGGLAYLFLFSGKSSGAGVAVVDLDRVTTEIGRDVTITQALQQQKANLSSQLNNLQTSLQEALATKKKEFGESPTEEQLKALQDLEKENNSKVSQAEMQSQQSLSQLQQQLLNDLRDEVRPIAAEVARKRGALLVLIPNPAIVLSADNSIEITDDVIGKLRPGSL